MHRENTLQQRDPVGASAFVRLFGVGGAVLAFLSAALITALESSQVMHWGFEIAALAVVALAGGVHVWWSSPFRAPYRRRMHATVLALLCCAFVLDELAQLGSNQVVHDDWGLVVISIYLYVFSAVRPPLDVLVGGLAVSLVVGCIVAAESPLVGNSVPAFTRATVALASTLPSAAAAAGFALVALRSLARLTADRAREESAMSAADLALSVQQEGIARLEAEVVPLLRDIVADGQLTREDGVLARRLATELRAQLVEDLDRGWLEELGFEVTDEYGYAERMAGEQRTAIRSILTALPLLDPDRPGVATLSGQDYDAVLELTVDLDHRPSRVQMAPPVLVLRTVFPHVTYRVDDGVVIVAEFRVPNSPAPF